MTETLNQIHDRVRDEYVAAAARVERTALRAAMARSDWLDIVPADEPARILEYAVAFEEHSRARDEAEISVSVFRDARAAMKFWRIEETPTISFEEALQNRTVELEGERDRAIDDAEYWKSKRCC